MPITDAHLHLWIGKNNVKDSQVNSAIDHTPFQGA